MHKRLITWIKAIKTLLLKMITHTEHQTSLKLQMKISIINKPVGAIN